MPRAAVQEEEPSAGTRLRRVLASLAGFTGDRSTSGHLPHPLPPRGFPPAASLDNLADISEASCCSRV